jgi:hypothetical protein
LPKLILVDGIRNLGGKPWGAVTLPTVEERVAPAANEVSECPRVGINLVDDIERTERSAGL